MTVVLILPSWPTVVCSLLRTSAALPVALPQAFARSRQVDGERRLQNLSPRQSSDSSSCLRWCCLSERPQGFPSSAVAIARARLMKGVTAKRTAKQEKGASSKRRSDGWRGAAGSGRAASGASYDLCRIGSASLVMLFGSAVDCSRWGDLRLGGNVSM